MKPTEKGFYSPTLDFLRPTREPGAYVFSGIGIDGDGLYLVTTHIPEQRGRRAIRTRTKMPMDVICSARPNDLGSLSVEFADGVEYAGNFGGSVQLRYPDEGRETSAFPYESVGRVRRGSTVVWSNRDLDQPHRASSLPRSG